MFLIIFGLLLSPITIAETLNKPLLQELLLPKNLAENKTIRLNCNLLQGESIEFEWTLNGQKINQTNKRKIITHEDSSELVIKSLSIDDLGEVKCIARNDDGEDTQSVSLYFNVQPIWIKEPQDVVKKLNEQINLECMAKGYPDIEIKWSKLDSHKKEVIEEFGSNKLKFILNKESSGYYKCMARNSMATIEKVISLRYYEN